MPAVQCPLPETIRRPSPENPTEVTCVRWPLNLRTSSPVWASHIRTLKSFPAVTIRHPSGENAAELTQAVCPANVLWTFPVSRSHSFATNSVVSPPAVRTVLPSGEKAVAYTAS